MATKGRKATARTKVFGTIKDAHAADGRKDGDRLWFVRLPDGDERFTWAAPGGGNLVMARVAKSLGWTSGYGDSDRVTKYSDAQILAEARRRGLIETNGDHD